MQFGFSYVGLVFLFMLMVPNMLCEAYLMVGFEENVPLYFAGEKEEKCAFVDVRVFGAVDPKQADEMTMLICQTLEMVLGIPASKTYVTYQGFTDWGWNGRNF